MYEGPCAGKECGRLSEAGWCLPACSAAAPLLTKERTGMNGRLRTHRTREDRPGLEPDFSFAALAATDIHW